MTFGGSDRVHGKDHENRKVHVSLVPPWFRADSRTNLIKQGENIISRPYGSTTHSQDAEPEKCNFNAPAIRKIFFLQI